MTLKDIIESKDFNLATSNTNLNKEIKGLYCCDLLSWVMSHAKKEDAWITVQTHINIVAVATLIETSCIIIPEGIEVDSDTIEKANEEDIAIIVTPLSTYEIFCLLYKLGLR